MAPERQPPVPASGDLAKRLTLALDYWEVTHGEPLTFPRVQEFLTSKGVSLSRSRWGYMIRGEAWTVRDRALLGALAELFGVSEDFLYTGNLSDEMLAELELVKAMRAARVENYAARTLGDLAPDAMRAISAALRDLELDQSRRDDF